MPPGTRASLAITFVLVPVLAGGCQPARPAAADIAAPRAETLGAGASVPPVCDERAAAASTAPPTISALESLPTGRACRVHLRRDALGLSSPAPLAVQQARGNSRPTLIEGTIERATGDWIVVRSAEGTYWVRTDFILVVEFPDTQ